MRKIAVVTGTRAEYGLLYWILKKIHEDAELQLQLIVTGAHLSPEFGLTVNEIVEDGFNIADKVEILLSSDTESAVAVSMGLGMIGFSKTYEYLRPDIILVLGDRFEILSAVAAAAPFKIPVAHIHGGESTEGAMDELFRHAITKMSHIHFPATKEYAKRIIRMGEDPNHVFPFGAPGLDNISNLRLLERSELTNLLDIPENKKIGIITYHPETLKKENVENELRELFDILKEFKDIYWVITFPNADMGGKAIIKIIKDFVEKNPDSSKLFTSLGALRYLSLLQYAVIMIGNSSSGIIEAPSFSLPVINLGNRQTGRIRARNVIDLLHYEKKQLRNAIKKAIGDEFRESLKGMVNPYGDGNTSEKIVNVLKLINTGSSLINKEFHNED